MTTAEPQRILALIGIETGTVDAVMSDGIHRCLALRLHGRVNGQPATQLWSVAVDADSLDQFRAAVDAGVRKHFSDPVKTVVVQQLARQLKASDPGLFEQDNAEQVVHAVIELCEVAGVDPADAGPHVLEMVLGRRALAGS